MSSLIEKRLSYSFCSQSPPQKSHNHLELEGSEFFEETDSVLGKTWDELDAVVFETNSRVFSFLPAPARSYYFGAMLYLSHSQNEKWCMALDMLIGTLVVQPLTNSSLQRSIYFKMLNEFNKEQLDVVVDYFDEIANSCLVEERGMFQKAKRLTLMHESMSDVSAYESK